MNYQLEVSSITKSYGDLKANDNVSLKIKDSSIHALLGENGAGKSTLVKIIYGSLMPSYKKTVLEPSEFIESIVIPRPANEDQLITHKISKRYEDDISAVCMAINVKRKDSIPFSVKIGMGGMSGIPQRAIELEKVFIDKWDKEELLAAAYEALSQEFTPFSDVRATSEFRLNVSAGLVKKSSLILQGYPVEDLAHYSEHKKT